MPRPEDDDRQYRTGGPTHPIAVIVAVALVVALLSRHLWGG